MYKEFNFCGIFCAPFFVRLVIAWLLYLPLHWLGDRIQVQRWVWNRAVFETALFVILLSALVLYV
ncbi:protein of unknown function DUF1656 [Chthoniobacter flavus Ellin428]|uniref:DUF1656 domain-containing protein n=1 Tax=Chthoniobacter flavus Ellin428 TaxID=497964 RepID=B4CUL3_9BACT|nr:DUF1656 domain-containing protein [Chthoniobacter flavus]EDY22251.1 protein of unknown function DUF1656 [Chthoniobacter flavus Ellin428]TCO94727.1 uncharacterized protein DUF1656 [Chthoniobacter flavus]